MKTVFLRILCFLSFSFYLNAMQQGIQQKLSQKAETSFFSMNDTHKYLHKLLKNTDKLAKDHNLVVAPHNSLFAQEVEQAAMACDLKVPIIACYYYQSDRSNQDNSFEARQIGTKDKPLYVVIMNQFVHAKDYKWDINNIDASWAALGSLYAGTFNIYHEIGHIANGDCDTMMLINSSNFLHVLPKILTGAAISFNIQQLNGFLMNKLYNLFVNNHDFRYMPTLIGLSSMVLGGCLAYPYQLKCACKRSRERELKADNYACQKLIETQNMLPLIQQLGIIMLPIPTSKIDFRQPKWNDTHPTYLRRTRNVLMHMVEAGVIRKFPVDDKDNPFLQQLNKSIHELFPDIYAGTPKKRADEKKRQEIQTRRQWVYAGFAGLTAIALTKALSKGS